MRSLKKIALTSLAFLAIGSLTLGVSALNASAADGEENVASITSADIVMGGASVRMVSPNGMRFHTYVDESFKANYTFGTLLIPASMLTDGEELTHETTGVMEIFAKNWQKTEAGKPCEYTCVLVGTETEESLFNEYPESEYGTVIVARSFAKAANGSYVYAATPSDRSLVEIASKALADESEDGKITNESKRNFLTNIVDTTLEQDGEANVSFSEDSIKISDAGTTTLTLSGCDRMSAIWEVEDESVLTVADGVITPKKVGETVVSAYVGSSKAEITVTVQRATLDALVVADGEMTWNTVYGASGYTVKVNGEVKQSSAETSYIFTEADKPEVYPYDVNVEVVADGVDGSQTAEVCLCGTTHPFNVSTGVANEYYIAEFHNQPAWGQFGRTDDNKNVWNPANEDVGTLTWGSDNIYTQWENQTRLVDGVLRVCGNALSWKNGAIGYTLPETLDISTIDTLSIRMKAETLTLNDDWNSPVLYLFDTEGTEGYFGFYKGSAGADSNFAKYATHTEKEDGWHEYTLNVRAWQASVGKPLIDLNKVWLSWSQNETKYFVDWVKYTKVASKAPKDLPEGATLISYADGDNFTISTNGGSTATVVAATTENGGSGAKLVEGTNVVDKSSGAVILNFNTPIAVNQTNTDSFAIKFRRTNEAIWQDNYTIVGINDGSCSIRVYSYNMWEIIEFNKEYLKDKGITEIANIQIQGSKNCVNNSVAWFIDSIFWKSDTDVTKKYCPDGATLLSGFDNKTGYSYISREGGGDDKYVNIVSSSGSGAYMTYVSLDYNYSRSVFSFDFKDITPEVLAGKTKIGIRYKVVAGSGANFGICDYEKYGTNTLGSTWVSATGNQSAGDWKTMEFTINANSYYTITNSLTIVMRFDDTTKAVVLLDSMWAI